MRAILFLLLVCLAFYGAYWLSSQPAALPDGSPRVQDTPRPSVYNLVLGAIDAQATAEAARRLAYDADQTQNQLIAAQTAQAVELTRQADTARAERERLDRQATADAVYLAEQATARANATATAQAWAMVGWTATADVARSTAEAAQTQIAVDYYRDTLDLELRRNRATNQALAWLPYVAYSLLFLLALSMGIISAIKAWKRPQMLQRDARGDIAILLDNSGNAWDPDRVPAGIVRLGRKGLQTPQLAPPELQSQTTARDQAIELASRGLPGQVPPTRGPVGRREFLPTVSPSARYQIFAETDPLPPLLQDPTLMSELQAQWSNHDHA